MHGVSILIPTHNRAAILAQTLESLRQMEMPPGVPVEVVVVANGCTDDTVQQAHAMFARMSIDCQCVIEPRGNLNIARNVAVANSRYDLCAIGRRRLGRFAVANVIGRGLPRSRGGDHRRPYHALVEGRGATSVVYADHGQLVYAPRIGRRPAADVRPVRRLRSEFFVSPRRVRRHRPVYRRARSHRYERGPGSRRVRVPSTSRWPLDSKCTTCPASA